MSITFLCKHFSALTIYELYDLMAIRQLVFAVEQSCIYLDADGKDLNAYHVMGFQPDGKLIACARLLHDPKWPGLASFGRIITHPDVRGAGTGKQLLSFVMKQMEQHFPGEAIRIGAQTYLIDYYKSAGFLPVGPEYLEDGIPHIDMVREA